MIMLSNPRKVLRYCLLVLAAALLIAVGASASDGVLPPDGRAEAALKYAKTADPTQQIGLPGFAISNYLATGSLSRRDYEDRPTDRPVDTIVIHHTALSGRRLSIAQVARSWQNDPAEVSAHFIVGMRGDILMTVPPSKTAFHILKQAAYPDPQTNRPVNWINMRSIGIEFHYDPDSERPSREQIVAGGRLIGALLNAYPDLDVARIIGHGVQNFSEGGRSRALSEPTYLFLMPNAQVAPNFLILLNSAAEISPRLASAIEQAGGVRQLATQLQQRTIAGQRLTFEMETTWKQDSNMPISPIGPQTAIAEATRLARELTGTASEPPKPTPEPPPLLDLTPRLFLDSDFKPNNPTQ
ncbi:N-acetylmuramoyl-L-alanine amidase [Limnothrix sp. FACHB-708]|nr:N-acetylmuramoyl-L-alanine amidase [Limnothrix sp. FACHB-708]MBD2592613.1 N-acetylmuramoyl-L-alanine amidase [Limnothrix sp. FACHB-406]